MTDPDRSPPERGVTERSAPESRDDSPRDLALAELSEQIERLGRSFGQLSRRDRMREDAFEQLYAELRQYKEDFIFQQEKPLLLDLLLFHDSLCWFRTRLDAGEMSPEVVSDHFQYLIDEFLEVMYRRDVLPMERSERFDRKTQKAMKVVYTPERSQDFKVSEVLRRGFTRAGSVLRAENVVLHRYRADALGQGSPGQGSPGQGSPGQGSTGQDD